MEKETKYIADIKGTRRTVLIMAFGLLLIIMSFTGFVNYMTFAKNYNNSLVSTYSVAGNEVVRKIEYALLYGKPINNYYGMNDTLNELKEVIDDVEQLKIVTPQGEVLYDLNGFVKDSCLPDELTKTSLFQQGTVNKNLSYQFYNEKAYLFIRINDNNAHHVANLVMVFPKDNFLQVNSPFTLQLLAYLIIIAILALILLTFIFFKTQFIIHNKLIEKRKVIIAFIIVLGSAQLIYSGINYMLFKNAYVDMADTSKIFIQKIVSKNIESIYTKGLSLQNVTGLDDYLDSIKESLPQIKDLSLVQPQVTQPENSQQLTSKDGLMSRSHGWQGAPIRVNATVSNAYIDQEMFKILLDMLTVLVISIFFMIELTLLAVILISRGPPASRHQSGAIDISASHGLVRALIYFVNVSAFMAMSFVAIVMKNLYEPVAGLSKDVVLGLPLSGEMLGGILAIIVAGQTIDKQGWRRLFFTGALFLAVGNCLSGMSPSAVPFILSRMIAGLGLGFIMMTIRSLIVSLPESNVAIAEFGAGSIAGLSCGAVIGGMLADRVGYDAVFFLAACGVIIPVIFVHRLMTQYEIAKRETSNTSFREKFTDFVADKKAMLFLLCIFIPYFICGAFLDYYFPLFAAGNGLSQSDISRGILLNSLFIIYLGPVLTRYVIKKLGNTLGMIVSMLIVICALAIFALFGGVAAAFVTIILLGIAESFGISMKTTYFLNLNGIKDLEINKGIAFFSIMVSFSRMAGPIVYGVALSLGARMGVGLISLVVIVLLLVFVVFTRVKSSPGNPMTTDL